MRAIVDFFEHISPLTRALLIAGGLVFFWMMESLIPLFKFRYRKVQHAGLNLFFTFTTVVINFIFAFGITLTSNWAVEHNFGLLHLVRLPLWLYILLGLMILDLISAYWIHYIQHQVKWMWKFHLVHHADTWVDTTTANRHHPGESIFRAVFTLLAVFVSGAPAWLVLLYQSISAGLSQFNHANIRLPRWLDNSISWLIVSPNMHKVHHHYTQPLTDTNYGIDTHLKAEENNSMTNLLQMPFQHYRAPVGSKFSDVNPQPEN
jgi:sterol desaturase/sphingolipid hydroxylase (fatty acid hydroxylase superfamily)